ncbi:MAG TPA: hypothetical protein VG318_18555 [Actinomycetota bacterium]|nr:hypothetical protein [Actinomycetota bacterium]
MDEELFQILSLFLLLGLLLTLFGVLQSLGAIRKALENGGAQTPQPQEASPAPAVETVAPAATETTSAGDDQSPLTWARPSEAEPATSSSTERSGWPSPQEAQPPAQREETPVAQLAAETPAESSPGGASRVLYGDRGLTTATPDEAALRPAAEPEPAAENPFETAAPETRREEPQPEPETKTAAAEDPQEQPFERDGRWWFRRGDELLVYEEQTGQWVAAGEPSTTGSVAAPAGAGGAASPQTETSSAGGAASGQVTTQLEQAGSFWKCPSCGAVNGSTATSCRMCFTARP